MTATFPTEDAKLQEFFAAYLEEVFHQQPTWATGAGDHRFDAQLDDISPAAREGWRALAQRTLDRLPEQIDPQKLSRDGQIDFDILQKDLRRQLWMTDHLHPFAEDPRVYGAYLSGSVYQLLAQSTLPRETNITNAIARMGEMARIIDEAKRSLTRPVRPMLETAIQQNAGAIRFYQSDVFRYAGETPQMDALKAAAAKVAGLLEEYQLFLEGPLRDRAVNDWRLGKEEFSRKFELETDAGISAEQNLVEAETEFARTQADLYNIARQLWADCFPGQPLPPDDTVGSSETVARVLHAVNQDHCDVTGLVTHAQATVESIRDFIRERHYLALPEPDRCSIVEMPEFRRGNALAYLESAPPLEPEAPSFYAVSPPPADWTPQQVRSFLEEYNAHMLKILTIHEAYPGHYVQLEYANRHPSLIRRLLQSGVYIEGWAVYGEAAMLNEGFGNGDLRLRLMQLKFYLRAIANSMLDYRMHCTQISDEAAMRFLMEDAFQSEGEAKLKVIRAKQSSVQLSTYFVGRMAFWRLRQQMEREMGNRFELGHYHEALLSLGSVPVCYLSELMQDSL